MLAVSVSARLLVPARLWRIGNQTAKIRKLVAHLAGGGCLTEFKVAVADSLATERHLNPCPVCRWIHDDGFTQIKTSQDEAITLGGILPDIVALVHQAHEQGFNALSTKDDKLLEICGGYNHPCKAFDDLKHRNDYKCLFDTRKRGFISLRGAVGINRNKSEARPE